MCTNCALLAGPVDVARVGVRAPSLCVMFHHLPHWSGRGPVQEWRGEALKGWIVWLWWGCGGMLFWCRPGCAVLLVDFWWASGGRSKFFGNRMVVCSGPVQPLSILPHPCSRRDEWLVIFYLVDVFHVVYKVICTPPPISLVLPHNRY